jgi:plasmid rolling circle replication initiator protein Rep
MWRARFFQALPQLLNDYPKAEFLFLTLTVRHRPANELRQTLAQMNKAWTLLTKRKQFPGLGYVKSTEVTRSANGYAHAHFHVLIMVTDGYFKRGYLSKDKWIELWQSCLKVDYAPSVDVKKVRERGKAAEKSSDPNVARLKAICETLKYSIKPSDLVADPEWFYEINRQLHKTRAVAVGGLLKNYLSEEEPEDLIHSDLDEEEDVPEQAKEITFGWREMYKRYAHNKDA